MQFLALVLVTAALDLGAVFLIFLYFRKRLRDEIGLGEVLERARREIGALVAEMNGAAERNVSLIEDRIRALNEALESAGRGFEALKRESEARLRERQAYERLTRASRQASLGVGMPQAAGSRPAPAEESPADSAASKAAVTRSADAMHPASTSQGRAGAADRVAAQGSDLPDIGAAEEPLDLGLQPSERAIELWKKGIAASVIASRTGLTVAEVELIIAMEEQRRLVSP